LTDDQFVAGTHTTKYLDEHLDPARIDEAQKRWGTAETATETGDNQESARREFTVEVDGKRFAVELEEHGAPAIDVDAVAGASGGAGPGTQPRPEQAGPGEDDEGTTATVGGTAVTAEMQGTILDVLVAEGDAVEAGEAVAVLEAMKMENDVVAEAGGTVTEVAVSEGDSVDMGDTLLVIE